ncbi:hypothetical protein ABZS94_39165 [Streptomyces sp. NPDC005500]|uniref:hypothetical protein n=1 Tax=Streptomyces sp. NPDC005500 TaxID=3155007 RepID=UPI0033A0E715
MSSAPTVRLDYVNRVNQQAGILGGAKQLARLAKSLEVLQPGADLLLLPGDARRPVHGGLDILRSRPLPLRLEWLGQIALADMNDPMGKASRFSARSSTATKTTALSNLHIAATRARKAVTAEQARNMPQAFNYLDLLFARQFPKR